MTDFTVPTDHIILGHADDLGSSQIRPGKDIGGGATADGADETDAWLRNARWAWAQANRACIAELHSYGADTPQAVIYTTTSASYVVVWQIPVKVASGRRAYTVTTDSEQCVMKFEMKTSGGTGRGSVETNGGTGVTTQVQRDDALSTSADDSAYLEISVKAQSGQTANVYGYRTFEDASTV
jgi:hypothetical protein